MDAPTAGSASPINDVRVTLAHLFDRVGHAVGLEHARVARLTAPAGVKRGAIQTHDARFEIKRRSPLR